MRIRLALLLLLPLLASCGVHNYDVLLKPTGELCRVGMRGYPDTFEAELLAADDSALYLLFDRAVLRTPLAAVTSIDVPNFGPSHNKAVWNLVPGALLLLYGSGAFGTDFFTGYAPIPTVGSIILAAGLFELASGFMPSPPYSFSEPFSPDEIKRLQLFSRYQAGLTNAQWRALLSRHRQERFYTP